MPTQTRAEPDLTPEQRKLLSSYFTGLSAVLSNPDGHRDGYAAELRHLADLARVINTAASADTGKREGRRELTRRGVGTAISNSVALRLTMGRPRHLEG